VKEFKGGNYTKIVPIGRREANEFIFTHHRHNKPPQGFKFAIGLRNNGKLIGVAIAGRPVARLLDNGKTIEITRVCTDGTKNANSLLYGRMKRICQLMGYDKIITYTLASESGSSLRAVGAKPVAVVSPSLWKRNSRNRMDQPVYREKKIRWEV